MPSTTLKLLETPEAIIASVEKTYPEIQEVLERANEQVKDKKQSIQEYQAAVLYLLAEQFNSETIVELGTKYGYSAGIIARACPDSKIFTVDTSLSNLEKAEKSLAEFSNIKYVNMHSWDFGELANDGKIAMVFVDADHEKAGIDMTVWWTKLREGGLIFFHDYDIEKYPDVYAAVHVYGEPDIIVVDTENEYGMAGIYKHG